MTGKGARPRPLGLVVWDGFGCAPPGPGNAVSLARMPHYAALKARFPHTRLRASGEAVGLMPGDMGNSNVGHLTMGAGRIVRQGRARVAAAVADGSLFATTVVRSLVRALGEGRRVHLLGLLSPGGVHSDQAQVFALIDYLRRTAGEGAAGRLFVHAFLDGRDVPPRSAEPDLAELERHLAGFGALASVGGRYYGMDRDRRWERVERAYRAIAGQEGPTAASGREALMAAYGRGEGDEFVLPTRIVDGEGRDVGPLRPGDMAFFWNFRADRAREMTRALAEAEFTPFDRRQGPVELATLVAYDEAFPLPTALGPVEVRDTVGEVVAAAGLTQLRAAETEKYAHVTYFFNGGRETQFAREERILVPSLKVATYDLAPAMSAYPLTERVGEALAGGDYDLFVLNYANADMVGHTGNLEATVQALEALDACLGRLAETVFARGGGLCLTADHGNAEQMRDEATGEARTAHTDAPVPFVLAVPGREGARLRPDGGLRDVGPTLLALLGLARPAAMEGRSLIEDDDAPQGRDGG
ncbi:MAG: 2,3-bisphosphoglycerate-independent phosphoglycerate mutase [Firmicutes bacterium]|nr:2,3-bisphosphoglycerate-independent phosphoglycerate mutase [Bacillota bacterium]